MKNSKLSEVQIIKILSKQNQALSPQQIPKCLKAGIPILYRLLPICLDLRPIEMVLKLFNAVNYSVYTTNTFIDA
ncbi:hypothetical protein D3C73_867160 [compost metagenome]